MSVFENLVGLPEDWQINPAAFTKFIRNHQCPIFLEYGKYPYVSSDKIKKALKPKAMPDPTKYTNMVSKIEKLAGQHAARGTALLKSHIPRYNQW